MVVPYLEYPQLLGVLLRMLSEGAPGVRREVMKVLGIIGALDPHTHKVNLAELQGRGGWSGRACARSSPTRTRRSWVSGAGWAGGRVGAA